MPAYATAVIPARLGSTRLAEKILLSETGKTLVEHVYEAASRAKRITRVVVATDHDRIAEAVRAFGGNVVMTRADHPNGTSRIAEACSALGIDTRGIVINVQGDEPDMEPSLIDDVVDALDAEGPYGAPIATVATPFRADERPDDPAVVKVVITAQGKALYFSRACIPFDRDGGGVGTAPRLKHLGVYGYRRAFLDDYTRLKPSPAELAEQLEQLRAIENGYAIKMVVREGRFPGGIDTRAQYDAFVRRWASRSDSGGQ